jgi:uncharacterized protein
MKSIANRIDAVDALRGFALLGIVILHFMEQFYAGPPPAGHENYTQHVPSDGVLELIFNIFLRGKFFMIFSFLFGLSFAIQMRNAEDKNIDFRGRFIWRLVILGVIGFIHNCFYRGDILFIYALMGLPLVLFYKVSNRVLLISAAVLMIVPRIIMLIINPQAADFEASIKWMIPQEFSYWHVVKNKGIVDVAWWNSGYGLLTKLFFQYGFNARGYQTLALFLIGLYAGNTRFFENITDKKAQYKKGLWWSLGIFLGLYAVGIVLYLVLKIDKILPQMWANTLGITLYDFSNIAQAAFYIFSFLLLFRLQWWQRQILRLAPYGRMALTNYVMQSVVGTFIFFGFGLGYLGDIGSTVAAILGLLLYFAQRYFSRWWLQRYHFGPLEWLWRSATYLKVQPFAKKVEYSA